MRFYCNKCDTDFETIHNEYSSNCPYCDKVIHNKKPKIHTDYSKTWCRGILQFQGGNQYGNYWRCDKCCKLAALQTEKQIKDRGIIKI